MMTTIEEGNDLINGFMDQNSQEYHLDWRMLIPVWVQFWDEANKLCFGKPTLYERLRDIRVMFMACVDTGDIANASRIMADSIQWFNNQKQ